MIIVSQVESKSKPPNCRELQLPPDKKSYFAEYRCLKESVTLIAHQITQEGTP